MIELATGDLLLLRAVAQHGSFTGAARELGYTQSAISRRVHGLESAAGHRLFSRTRAGVHPTEAGEILLRNGAAMLEAAESAERELAGFDGTNSQPVRLGAFASAAAGLLPKALSALAEEQPAVVVTVREATSALLLRSLRAGTIDLAVVVSVPPYGPLDDRQPPLEAEVIAERDLLLAVGAGHRLAGRTSVRVEELAEERWVLARSEGAEHLLGVWPSASPAPNSPYVVRDWLTKLRLVAAGLAVTTVPFVLVPALPPDVQTIRVEVAERRRVLLVHAPFTRPPGAAALAEALRDAVSHRESRPAA